MEQTSAVFIGRPHTLFCVLLDRATVRSQGPIVIEHEWPMRSTVVGDVSMKLHHNQTRAAERTPLIGGAVSHDILRTARSQQVQRLQVRAEPI